MNVWEKEKGTDLKYVLFFSKLMYRKKRNEGGIGFQHTKRNLWGIKTKWNNGSCLNPGLRKSAVLTVNFFMHYYSSMLWGKTGVLRAEY